MAGTSKQDVVCNMIKAKSNSLETIDGCMGGDIWWSKGFINLCTLR
jgi:hypothetical protein